MSGFCAEVTPLVLTRDEGANIGRTLGQLSWAHEVILVDSGSTDATLTIAAGFKNVRVVERPLDDLAAQWAFAVAQARTEWVLTLDADYFVPEAFSREIDALEPQPTTSGYEAAFVYAIDGRPLRATLYTPRVVLARRASASFFMDGHTQRIRIDGVVAPLRERLIHDDRKPLTRFLQRQVRYMRDEAAKIRSAEPRTLGAVGRIRRLRVVAPILIVPYVLFAKGLILDGSAGFRYAFERLLAECILSIELLRPVRASSPSRS